MDWTTLTKRQIEDDALPRVCMVCGDPATCSVNKSFTHTPDWVQWLYFAGIFPGLIAEHFCTQETRVACPFCDQHKNHWNSLYWLAGIGWLVSILLFGGLGWVVGMATDSIRMSAIIGAGIGLLAWLVPLIWMACTRIRAKRITSNHITLQGVHDSFARTVKEQQVSATSGK